MQKTSAVCKCKFVHPVYEKYFQQLNINNFNKITKIFSGELCKTNFTLLYTATITILWYCFG